MVETAEFAPVASYAVIRQMTGIRVSPVLASSTSTIAHSESYRLPQQMREPNSQVVSLRRDHGTRRYEYGMVYPGNASKFS